MGVNVNLVDGYIILLIVVCLKGNIIVIKFLVKVGVDVNLSNGYRILFISVCEMG